MRKHPFFSTFIVAAVALAYTAISFADGPVHNNTLVPFFNDVRAGMCDPTNDAVGMITAMTPNDTPLFNHTRRGPPLFPVLQPASCDPLLAPDGHQVTLGELKAVTGRATLKCINQGTHSVLHYSNLLPFGTYSVWLVLPNPMPPPGNLGVGALGPTDNIQNAFTASASGEGQISLITPQQMLSVFGSVGPCFLDGLAEIHLVYHGDGQTHGPTPGPLATWQVVDRFFFP
jgi:hypothetical protein